MSLKIGQKAPDFSLTNTEKQSVSLSQFQGQPLVLLFFPMAFSSVCTEEMCAVRDGFDDFQDLQAVVLGISVDSLFTLARFKQDYKLPFEMLSDFNKEVSAAYGALHEEFAFGMKGVSKRSAFVIDAEGVVRYAEVSDHPPTLPNFKAVRETLASLNANV